MTHEVWLTGYGLLSSLGETADAWWDKLQDRTALDATIDSATYRPFHVHPAAEYDLATQVPKRGDQRAMGPMMQSVARFGV